MYFNIVDGKIEYINNREKTKREFKGNSLIDFPCDYVVVDIETTGLDCNYDEIIEIAALKVINNKVVDKFQTLVKPEKPINDFITELTGISNEMVETSPRIEEVIPIFKHFIGEFVLVGHNVSFDINFLYDSFKRVNGHILRNDFVDTKRLSKKILPNLEHHRLSDLVEYYKLGDIGAHRAFNDVVMTNNLFLKLKKDVLKTNISIEEFKKSYRKKIKFSDTTSTINNIDETNIFYKKNVTITGTLEKMLRKDAMQLLANLGAKCQDNITNDTNFLILGNNDYNSILRGKKSHKLINAEKMKLKGYDISIISENVFYDTVEDHIINRKRM